MRFKSILALCVVAVPCSFAQAADVRLNAKPGLWESTVVLNTSGMPDIPSLPPEHLARLTSEQRAQIETAMGTMAGKPQTVRSCVTAAQARKGFDFGAQNDPACRRDVIVSSSSRWEVRETCTGAHPRSMHATFTAPDPETVNGDMDMMAASGGRTINTKGKMTGRWLGTDCGTVKPMESAN